MKEKMIEFLLKRIGGKVNDLRDSSLIDDEMSNYFFDDIDAYLQELKSAITELLV